MKKIFLIFLLIIAISTTAFAEYSFYMAVSMISPQEIYPSIEDGYIRYEDDFLRIHFLIGSLGINFILANKTDETLKIVWDNSAYIDPLKISHRVIHSGVRYMEKGAMQPPTAVPANTSATDVIFPADNVQWEYNSWQQYPLFPSMGSLKKNEETYPGLEFGVLLAIEIGNSIKEYVFKFRIDDIYSKKYLKGAKKGDIWFGVFGYPKQDGLLILSVIPNTPAAKANIKQGDRIIAINEKPTNSMKAFTKALKSVKIGEEYDVIFIRNGQKDIVTITAESYKPEKKKLKK